MDSIEGEQVITEDAGQQEFRLKDEQIKVLLSRKLWERAQSKEERKRSIARYIQTGYPNYRIEKVVKDKELPSNLQEGNRHE